MPRPLHTLASRLVYARKMRGLNQTKLAEAAGMKQPDISKLEQGINFTTTGIARLAAALGVPARWLELHEGPEPVWGDDKGSPDDAAAAPGSSVPRAQRIVVSANLQIPEARLFAQLLVAAKLPGVSVEVQQWEEKKPHRRGKTLGGDSALSTPAKTIKTVRES